MRTEKLRPLALTFVLLTSLAAAALGCRHATPSPEQQFRELFEGYQLDLVSDLPKEGAIEQVNISSLPKAYPTESRMTPGRIYVFRKTTHTGDESIGLKLLPKRLAMIGAKVTKAPQSSRDLIYVYDGGPIFNIEFDKDGHAGKIFNQSANPQNAVAGPDWLILVYS